MSHSAYPSFIFIAHAFSIFFPIYTLTLHLFLLSPTFSIHVDRTKSCFEIPKKCMHTCNFVFLFLFGLNTAVYTRGYISWRVPNHKHYSTTAQHVLKRDGNRPPSIYISFDRNRVTKLQPTWTILVERTGMRPIRPRTPHEPTKLDDGRSL